MDGHALYEGVKKSLGLSIFLAQLAIALSALFLVFTLQDSFRVLSLIGIFDDDQNYEQTLNLAWVVLALVVASFAVSRFIFLRRARKLFEDENNAIQCFGTSAASTGKSLMEVQKELRRYAAFALPLAFAIAVLNRLTFVNVLLAATLTFILVVLFLFYRDNAKLLRCDEELLS